MPIKRTSLPGSVISVIWTDPEKPAPEAILFLRKRFFSRRAISRSGSALSQTSGSDISVPVSPAILRRDKAVLCERKKSSSSPAGVLTSSPSEHSSVTIISEHLPKSASITLIWTGVKPVNPSRTMTESGKREDEGIASHKISSFSSLVI